MVLDLTKMGRPGGDAHGRAFEDVVPVVAMLKKRMAEGQTMGNTRPDVAHTLESAVTVGR